MHTKGLQHSSAVVTYAARPGVEYPMKVHSIGLELNCDVFSWSFIIAVLNSVGVNVTVIFVLPWAGTIPIKVIAYNIMSKLYKVSQYNTYPIY